MNALWELLCSVTFAIYSGITGATDPYDEWSAGSGSGRVDRTASRDRAAVS